MTHLVHLVSQIDAHGAGFILKKTLVQGMYTVGYKSTFCLGLKVVNGAERTCVYCALSAGTHDDDAQASCEQRARLTRSKHSVQ